jgi:O-antigen/teichoic acid export membrane protein
VYSVLVGRFLGGAALGYAGLALAVGIGGAQLATAGLGPATTRFTAVLRAAGDLGGSRLALLRGVSASVAVGCVLALCALVLGDLWSEPIGLPAALVGPTAALIAMQSGYIGLKSGMYGVGRVAAYARSEVVAGIGFAVALVALLAVRSGMLLAGPEGVALADGARSLLAPFIVANAIFIVLAVWYLRRAPVSGGFRLAAEELVAGERSASSSTSSSDPPPSSPPSSSPQHTSLSSPSPASGSKSLRFTDGLSMPRYAAIATVGTAAAMARVHLAVLATGLRWPAAEVGMLQAALAFMAAVLLVPRAVELALFPALARSYGRTDSAAFRDQLGEMLAVTVVVLAAVSGALIVAGPALLALVLGPEFAGAQASLYAVVVSAWLIGLAVPAVAALSSADAVAVPNAAGVLGLLTSVALWLWLVPEHGAAGAAAGLAVGSLVTSGLPLVAARRLYGLPLAPSASSMLRSLLLLAAALVLTRVASAPLVPIAALYVAAIVVLERGRLASLTACIPRSLP